MTDRYANRRGTLRPSYRGAAVDPDVFERRQSLRPAGARLARTGK